MDVLEVSQDALEVLKVAQDTVNALRIGYATKNGVRSHPETRRKLVKQKFVQRRSGYEHTSLQIRQIDWKPGEATTPRDQWSTTIRQIDG